MSETIIMHAALEHIEANDLGHLPRELVDFARRQIVNAILYKGDERRREDRHPMLLPVRAVEIDENDNPVGQPFDLVTRDVSATSVGLISTEKIQAKQLAVEMVLAGTAVILAVEMRWSGEMGPFYGAAGSYARRLPGFPGEG